MRAMTGTAPWPSSAEAVSSRRRWCSLSSRSLKASSRSSASLSSRRASSASPCCTSCSSCALASWAAAAAIAGMCVPASSVSCAEWTPTSSPNMPRSSSLARRSAAAWRCSPCIATAWRSSRSLSTVASLADLRSRSWLRATSRSISRAAASRTRATPSSAAWRAPFSSPSSCDTAASCSVLSCRRLSRFRTDLPTASRSSRSCPVESPTAGSE
mmetsp:Transcript_31862/g.82473  ORF Transcript_31862/g.82473 Transcript_31862/m.82473 type:complete len:214 (+) Transcript_31862:122-763(+)